MKTILVQMSDKQWTTPAVHLACALARNTQAQIILLRLLIVEHPAYLGSEFGYSALTSQEREDIADYKATAEDYDITLTTQAMECLAPIEGLIDAAKQLEADSVFAHVPQSSIPQWQKFQKWVLHRRLASPKRQVFLPDSSDQAMGRLPTITAKTTYTLSGR